MREFKTHQHALAFIVIMALASAYPLITVWGFALFGDQPFADSSAAVWRHFSAMGLSNPKFN